MALLGFAAGLPILLIFSSLSLWLAEAGVARCLGHHVQLGGAGVFV